MILTQQSARAAKASRKFPLWCSAEPLWGKGLGVFGVCDCWVQASWLDIDQLEGALLNRGHAGQHREAGDVGFVPQPHGVAGQSRQV